jgi:hypothetical protein
MPRLISTRALWTLARAGHLSARVWANREGVTAIRLYLAGAAVDTGLLDALAGGGASTGDLARRMGVDDEAEQVTRALADQAPRRVLDIGCGAGLGAVCGPGQRSFPPSSASTREEWA